MKTDHQRTFRLFVERDSVAGLANSEPSAAEVIELDGLMSLQVFDNLIATAEGVRDRSLVLEPLADLRVPYVAMAATDPQAVVRVNGAVVGPTHVLQVRDVIEWGTERLALHLTMFQRPYVGPPQQHHASRECAVCLTPIGKPVNRADSPTCLILECVVCRAVLHERALLPDTEDEWLECSRTVAVCPCCESTLVRKEGYVYVPDF